MIQGINYNWFATPDGESFTSRGVGFMYHGLKCVKISEHKPAGEGDKWYYDIHYSDGSIERVFNPNAVFFAKNDVRDM